MTRDNSTQHKHAILERWFFDAVHPPHVPTSTMGAVPRVPRDPQPFIPPLRIMNSGLNSNMSDVTTVSQSINVTAATVDPTPEPADLPCQWILYTEIPHSKVRLWDVIILIPNVIFFAFLLLRLRTTIVKLRRTSSPIFMAFYGLVFLTAVISVLRCVVSMTVNAAVLAGDVADKCLWLVLRFFMLATELSVVTFGLAFGHLDSKTSIRRVLIVTFTIALAYSVTQGVLEFIYPDLRFHVKYPDREYDIFGHGGMVFWFVSSIFFSLIYTSICIMPFTQVRYRFALPTKRSFYWYCCFLAINNCVCAIGSGMLLYNQLTGLCIVDVTTYIYFVFFAPLVYGTFLRDFFSTSQPSNILFSYKAQVDESLEDDSVSMPQQICSSGKLEADLTVSGSYDSTHFDGPNPLYHQDYQPPRSELVQVADFYGNDGTSINGMPGRL